MTQLLIELLASFGIGIGLQWFLGFPDWRFTTLLLIVLVFIHWATRRPGHTFQDLRASAKDFAWIGIALAIFATLRILVWFAFDFSMIESFSTGHSVGPRGAFNLSTSPVVRETIIWELLVDGLILVVGFVLARTIIPTQKHSQES